MTTHNPFRQVALTLIGLTIVVLGVVHNQTVSRSQAELPRITSSTPTADLPNVNEMINNLFNTTNPSTPTPIPPDSSVTTPDLPDQTDQNEITPPTSTNAIPLDTELLAKSLDWLTRLINVPPDFTFAYGTPEISLPGIGLATILPSITPPVTGGTITIPTVTSPVAPITPSIETAPTTPAPSQNEVLNTIKLLTGYAKWEEFRDNFREAQQKYAGTGKCMIEIKGFGCLVTW